MVCSFFFFFSSRRRHTRCGRDWSSDVCSSDLGRAVAEVSMASTKGQVRVPGRVLAAEVIQAVKAQLFELGIAGIVFAVHIGTGINSLNGPVGLEPVLKAKTISVGFAQLTLVVKQLVTGERVQVNGLLVGGQGRRRQG